LTQQLNFYSVGRLFNIIDMPGYGFAFVDEDKRRQWRELVSSLWIITFSDGDGERPI
jgi:GTP-binding protein EngB required for normal cell division